ncbi:hypothetical protein HK096_007883 [Nowakowskiella sp. JEL0078]|nr:hypothetical protein HK096_007883 [Nowakowskiella sp. JEL0078]
MYARIRETEEIDPLISQRNLYNTFESPHSELPPAALPSLVKFADEVYIEDADQPSPQKKNNQKSISFHSSTNLKSESANQRLRHYTTSDLNLESSLGPIPKDMNSQKPPDYMQMDIYAAMNFQTDYANTNATFRSTTPEIPNMPVNLRRPRRSTSSVTSSQRSSATAAPRHSTPVVEPWKKETENSETPTKQESSPALAENFFKSSIHNSLPNISKTFAFPQTGPSPSNIQDQSPVPPDKTNGSLFIFTSESTTSSPILEHTNSFISLSPQKTQNELESKELHVSTKPDDSKLSPFDDELAVANFNQPPNSNAGSFQNLSHDVVIRIDDDNGSESGFAYPNIKGDMLHQPSFSGIQPATSEWGHFDLFNSHTPIQLNYEAIAQYLITTPLSTPVFPSPFKVSPKISTTGTSAHEWGHPGVENKKRVVFYSETTGTLKASMFEQLDFYSALPQRDIDSENGHSEICDAIIRILKCGPFWIDVCGPKQSEMQMFSKV